MAYEKQNWENYPSEETPISAERLTHIEDGIYEVSENKQDTLIPGDNITIDENNVISATGGGGGSDPMILDLDVYTTNDILATSAVARTWTTMFSLTVQKSGVYNIESAVRINVKDTTVDSMYSIRLRINDVVVTWQSCYLHADAATAHLSYMSKLKSGDVLTIQIWNDYDISAFMTDSYLRAALLLGSTIESAEEVEF